MKRTLLLLFVLGPVVAMAQHSPSAGVGLGKYRLGAPKYRLAPHATRTTTPQNLPPGSYESHPHTLRILSPDSAATPMPTARTASPEAGGVVPLPQQQYETKRRP